MREHFVVSSIRSREVAGAQRSSVPHREDALKALDFSNGLLGVHPVSISNMSLAIVKRSDPDRRFLLKCEWIAPGNAGRAVLVRSLPVPE
jgi:hypothetical protein